jgi:hypothetical protein
VLATLEAMELLANQQTLAILVAITKHEAWATLEDMKP